MRDASDDLKLGAGNVVFWLRDKGEDLQKPRLWLDRPWLGPDGNERAVLSLRDILICSAAYRQMYRQLGVQSRDVVLIQLKTPVEVFLHWIALSAEGAIAAAVNPNLPHDMLRAYSIRIGAVGALFGSTQTEGAYPNATVLSWHDLATGGSLVPSLVPVDCDNAIHDVAYPYQPNDIVLLYHTSGTTGQPKAVCASHHGFMVGIRSELRQKISPLLGSAMLNALPAAHQSSFATITRALLSDTKLILASDQSADTLVEGVRRFEPDCISSFSCTMRDVARLRLPPGALQSVSLWMTTGDSSRRGDIAAVSALGTHPVAGPTGITRAPGMYVLDNFGSSELGHVHFSFLHAPGHTHEARCIGRPAGFVRAAIVDESGEELPEHRVGYLAVQSGSVTPGYWNDPERTAAARRGPYWITGDVGFRDAFGRYFHFDRHTDVIDTDQGHVYSVRNEEELLSAVPEIERCAVVGRRDADGRVRAVCLIECADSARDADAWHLHINAVLAKAALPAVSKTIVCRPGSIPQGPTGKVRKFVIRERLQDSSRPADGHL